MNAKATTRRPWTAAELEYVRLNVGPHTIDHVARMLDRTLGEVRHVRDKGDHPRLVVRRPWTEAERQAIRGADGLLPVRELARRLGLTPPEVYRERARMGLTIPRIPLDDTFDAYVRDRHAVGWSDAEIAAGYSRRFAGHRPVGRHSVGERRVAFGLTDNRLSDYQRRRVAAKTAEQLRAARLPTLAAVRAKAFRDYAVANGWPEDLRPRAVQILNAIWDGGPMTRVELARAIGARASYDRPHGEASVLASNDPEGSYLAHLTARGMVVVFKRAGRVTGRGKGRSVDVYSLSPDIKRRKVADCA